MQLRHLGLGLLTGTSVLGHGVERCGTHRDVEPDSFVGSAAAQLQSRQTYPVPPPTNLIVHVVAPSKKREDGYLSVCYPPTQNNFTFGRQLLSKRQEAEVLEQVKIVQDAYAKPDNDTGIRFLHDKSKIRWHVNESWTGEVTGDKTLWYEMSEALHEGDYRTLNLYFFNQTHQRNGGTCTNPWTQARREADLTRRLKRDGCIIATYSINGSKHPYMNRGKTAIHEIGHWFGLHHPFEAGESSSSTCSDRNVDDEVLDTPKTGMGVEGACDRKSNTCAEPKGQTPIYDPVENYMMYSSDDCMSQFTKGQA